MHLYSFQPKSQHDLEYTGYIDDMGSLIKQIPANQAYVYPDLQQDTVIYTYDFGEDWVHEITLKRTLTFDEIKAIQVPSCVWNRGANYAEDGGPRESAILFDRSELNDKLALWSLAGEQLIRGDDLGLTPKFD